MAVVVISVRAVAQLLQCDITVTVTADSAQYQATADMLEQKVKQTDKNIHLSL